MFNIPLFAKAAGTATLSPRHPRQSFTSLGQSGSPERHRVLASTISRLAAARLRRVDQGRRQRALLLLNSHLLRDIGLG